MCRSVLAAIVMLICLGKFAFADELKSESRDFLLQATPGISAFISPRNNPAGLDLGIGISGLIRLSDTPLFIGGTLGYHKFSNLAPVLGDAFGQALGSSAPLSRIWTTGVPVMGTALYRFNEQNSIRPYLGFSAGVALISSELTDHTQSQSDWYFTGVLHPGVEFNFGRFGISVEPQVSLLGANVGVGTSSRLTVAF